ncbi:4-(cytidine 5'-diphospho)-2-C-methyl-D-erythritol kinase [Ruminococcus gauvreauii]|uniref:4-diphosphocytidyl-2-C-methyl-D-erythritol kinase n=1 Tax=Ruminococcus gauvreauii TaxID=438033 RepID=A0ABY5VL62_9FIRM|nr:4-(cytidine 5'-diphospho)-2-C-methyl-D-erythritol kinase [Ruminococcus gauvreauii]UWP60941.1 4-(cytidine 5'-diphospho)-2-C-methyl-D-erythritol kinase [Ruminococcus gauvreauii]
MRLRALAKINLGLDVVRKREDGYHEVRMIMQTIKMYDQLDMQKIKQPGIRLQTNLPYLPVNENNLVYKASKLLMDEFGIREGLTIDLKKVIPVAAGMAGGSSDAAAAMMGVNKIFGLGLSRRDLMQRATAIGADVPYCILRGTALAEGIGERLTELSPMPQGYVLIGKPGVSVSTKFVYGNLNAAGLASHPDIDGMIAALEARDFYGVASRLENVLENVTIPAYPVIADIKQKMRDWGAVNALMSGSGPTVFGLFDDREKAEYAHTRLKKSRLVRQSFLTTFYNNGGRHE